MLRLVAALLSISLLGCGGAAPAAAARPPTDSRASAATSGETAMEPEVERVRALYGDALAAADGDRAAVAPRAIVEEHAGRLARAYVADPTSRDALATLELLAEMRTPRAWPAFVVALDWRLEQTEEHAIVAARALEAADFSSVDASTRAAALGRALERVEGERGADNRMRINFIRALARIDHPASADALRRVMDREDPAQSFLINRMAAEGLGQLSDLRCIPSLVLALFRFPASSPHMRMNDVAASALVERGRHALAPALALLRGENPEALAIARRYVDAIRAIAPTAAAQLTPESIVREEAAYLIGQLGFAEGLEPLLAETRASDPPRRVGAAVALVSLAGIPSADVARVREALERVYRSSEPDAFQLQLQLLVAMQHTYDAGHLPFLLRLAQRPDDELPDRRIIAYRAAAMLAGRRDAIALRRIAARPTDEHRAFFAEQRPALDAAERCDEDVACWRGLLTSDDPLVVRKAATMLARLSAPTDVVPALLAQLGSEHVDVRGDVLYALDRVCTAGCEEVIAAIDALREREEGRSSWNQVQSLALAIRGRQRARIAAR